MTQRWKQGGHQFKATFDYIADVEVSLSYIGTRLKNETRKYIIEYLIIISRL